MLFGTCGITGHYTEQLDTSGKRKKTSHVAVRDGLAEKRDETSTLHLKEARMRLVEARGYRSGVLVEAPTTDLWVLVEAPATGLWVLVEAPGFSPANQSVLHVGFSPGGFA